MGGCLLFDLCKFVEQVLDGLVIIVIYREIVFQLGGIELSICLVVLVRWVGLFCVFSIWVMLFCVNYVMLVLLVSIVLLFLLLLIWMMNIDRWLCLGVFSIILIFGFCREGNICILCGIQFFGICGSIRLVSVWILVGLILGVLGWDSMVSCRLLVLWVVRVFFMKVGGGVEVVFLCRFIGFSVSYNVVMVVVIVVEGSLSCNLCGVMVWFSWCVVFRLCGCFFGRVSVRCNWLWWCRLDMMWVVLVGCVFSYFLIVLCCYGLS